MEKQNEMLPENEEQISNESNTAQNETITQSVAEEYSFDMLVDMTEEEREAFFEENGKSIGDMDFDKNLTEDELSEMKDEIYRLNDELMETTEEKVAITKQYGDRIESLQTQMNTVTTNVKKGTKPVCEPCVKVIDMKGKRVYFFAQSTGQCVLVRGITPSDLEQEFPFVTVYNVTDEEGERVELSISRNGGMPELNDRTSNENGDYTLDDGTLITIENGKVSNIEVPEQEDSAEDTDED